MGVFAKYPEIELLHRVPDIMQEPEVVVTEKIHGTNARFGWGDGRFRIGGSFARSTIIQSPLSSPAACFGRRNPCRTLAPPFVNSMVW